MVNQMTKYCFARTSKKRRCHNKTSKKYCHIHKYMFTFDRHVASCFSCNPPTLNSSSESLSINLIKLTPEEEEISQMTEEEILLKVRKSGPNYLPVSNDIEPLSPISERDLETEEYESSEDEPERAISRTEVTFPELNLLVSVVCVVKNVIQVHNHVEDVQENTLWDLIKLFF